MQFSHFIPRQTEKFYRVAFAHTNVCGRVCWETMFFLSKCRRLAADANFFMRSTPFETVLLFALPVNRTHLTEVFFAQENEHTLFCFYFYGLFKMLFLVCVFFFPLLN